MVPAIVPSQHVFQTVDWTTTDGIPLAIPRGTFAQWLEEGRLAQGLSLRLSPCTLKPSDLPDSPTVARASPSPTPRPLSMTEAATCLSRALTELSLPGKEVTVAAARHRVRRACDNHRVMSVGKGKARKIDSDEFNAWMQEQKAVLIRSIDLAESS